MCPDSREPLPADQAASTEAGLPSVPRAGRPDSAVAPHANGAAGTAIAHAPPATASSQPDHAPFACVEMLRVDASPRDVVYGCPEGLAGDDVAYPQTDGPSLELSGIVQAFLESSAVAAQGWIDPNGAEADHLPVASADSAVHQSLFDMTRLLLTELGWDVPYHFSSALHEPGWHSHPSAGDEHYDDTTAYHHGHE